MFHKSKEKQKMLDRQLKILKDHIGETMTAKELKSILPGVAKTTYIGDCSFANFLTRKNPGTPVLWLVDPLKF